MTKFETNIFTSDDALFVGNFVSRKLEEGSSLYKRSYFLNFVVSKTRHEAYV